MATSTASTMTTAPKGASRARAARRRTFQRGARPRSDRGVAPRPRRSARLDHGSAPAIEHVDDQVAQDEPDGDQQDDALHERIVPREDGIDHKASHAGQREDILRDDGAADERPELEPEHGDTG